MSSAAPPRPRRAPPRPPRPPSVGGGADVFVSMRTDFRAQLRRCQRLLGPGGPELSRGGPGGGPEIRLHGLGLAVTRAINLALQLQAAAPPGSLRLHASTSSVLLPGGGPGKAGPPPPGDEEEEGEGAGEEGAPPPPARLRHNSAIHIRVCREAPCA